MELAQSRSHFTFYSVCEMKYAPSQSLHDPSVSIMIHRQTETGRWTDGMSVVSVRAVDLQRISSVCFYNPEIQQRLLSSGCVQVDKTPTQLSTFPEIWEELRRNHLTLCHGVTFYLNMEKNKRGCGK